MSDDVPLRAAVTVSDMARMVGLSRARFYQLQKAGVFPPPTLNPSTKRPFYDQEAQKLCLEVRRKNVGVNGQVVLFYARRHEIAAPRNCPPKRPKTVPEKSGLVDALKSLGLKVTATEVEEAVKDLGLGGKDKGEVIRAVFLHLKRRDSAGNVGR